ncbi:MAG TPA: SBBP repeat-containing protein [Candidatus Acidoferrales bacterium]|nr:SBBP repeat-containing protein [Candidatus Acidoferrales bacterium]
MGRLSLFAGGMWSVCLVASAAPNTVLSRLPLRFEENRGQFHPAVRYTARTGGYNVQLTDRGPAFLLGGQRVEIAMVHGNPAPRLEGVDRMAAPTNYFVGRRESWHTGVANYARVRYSGVYPGVDIVYYGNRGQLEYDFELRPGVNPDAIRMRFDGAGSVFLSQEGDLVIEAAGEQAVQKKPVILQNGRPVAGHYTLLAHNQAGLVLDAYDRNKPLVIDPIIVFGQYFGSSGTDQVNAMKLGPNGTLYITGQTTTGEMPYIDGAYDNFNDGLIDIFLAIMSTDASKSYPLLYFSYLGGSDNDIPLGLDVDSNGVAYLTGYTASTDFPMAGSSFQTVSNGVQVAFAVKLDPSQYGGNGLVYSSFLGGTTGLNTGNGLVVDSNGVMYIVGTTRCTDFPVTGSAYAGVLYGPQDAFITVMDPNSGTLVYSTYMGGELSDDGRAIAVGSNGLVYFAANTYSTQFPIEGPFWRNTLQGGIDVVVGVIDITKSGNGAGGSMIYSSYIGGSDLDEVRAMSLDANNRMLLTGYTFSTDFPTTSDAVQSGADGNGDAFVTIVDPGNPPSFMTYSTYFGGSQTDVAYAVRSDNAGGVYFAGYTLSPDLYTVAAPQPGSGGGTNMFMARIKPGTPGRRGIQFSSYLGAFGTYVGNSIVIGSDGSAYFAGYGQSGLPTWNGYKGGVSDGFLVVLK